MPNHPRELAGLDGVVLRSVFSGRVVLRRLRRHDGVAEACEQRARMAVDDPEALVQGVLMHMGVGLMAMPHVMHYLEGG